MNHRFASTEKLLQEKIEEVGRERNIKTNKKCHWYSQFLNQLLQVALGGLFGQDLEHLLADVADLARLSIAGGLDTLVGLLLGESNSKDTQVVAISGAHVDGALNEGLPLADQTAQLVASNVHAVEVSDDVSSLHVLTNQSDLSVSLLFITTVQVSQGELEHAALQLLRSNF